MHASGEDAIMCRNNILLGPNGASGAERIGKDPN